jgi:hypothetical protein
MTPAGLKLDRNEALRLHVASVAPASKPRLQIKLWPCRCRTAFRVRPGVNLWALLVEIRYHYGRITARIFYEEAVR